MACNINIQLGKTRSKARGTSFRDSAPQLRHHPILFLDHLFSLWSAKSLNLEIKRKSVTLPISELHYIANLTVIMPNRIILRIEISAVARQEYSDLLESFGLIGVATASRLIEWFVKQDEESQAFVLGFHPTMKRSELATIMLKRIVNEIKRSD